MRIPDDWLDVVFYLYPDRISAETSARLGGTGFLVAVTFDDFPDRCAVYAVTNRHVIDDGSPVVRINTGDGKFDIIEATDRNWLRHPDGDDIAISQISLDGGVFKFKFLQRTDLLTEAVIKEHGLGPGEDVFVIGRFVNSEGTTRNVPSVRFGNIAQMSGDPIRIRRQTGYFEQTSFVVEARSIPGYSGSPVFVFIPPLSSRPGKDLNTKTYGPWLLGIDFCHINDHVPAIDHHGNELPFKVRVNSGMMGVIPAMRLDPLFDLPVFKEGRRQMQENYRKKVDRERDATPVSLDSAKPVGVPTKDANPQHREDFTALLGEAARKQPRDE